MNFRITAVSSSLRFLMTLMGVAMTLMVSATTIEVCRTCVWSSVKEAIMKSCEGDTIRIHPGVYQEYNIPIIRPLVILGEKGAILDAQGKGSILIVHANDVTIQGLTLRNTGNSYVEDRSAIRIKKAQRFMLSRNKLENTVFGIYLEHARNGVVFQNQFIGQALEEASSGNGIHLWYCKQILIEGNYIKGHRDGIYLEFADSCNIQFNISENNLRYGLHFMFSNDDDYFQNVFRDNGAGVAVMFSRRIRMWENTFVKNWGKASYGLLLKEIYDLEIHRNIFKENTIGIFIEGSNRVTYRQNEFIQNGWALKIAGGCLENTVTENNFISNTFDMAMYSGASDNSFDGNYWSGYEGYDLNRDGIGDIPYHPVKLFNFIVNETPEAMILLRSLFIDLLNLAEKVSPVFTPQHIADQSPKMQPLFLPLASINRPL